MTSTRYSVAMGLAVATTVVSLSIITWMWAAPLHFVAAGHFDLAALRHIAGFALVRTVALSVVFGYAVMRKQAQVIAAMLMLMALVQLGDVIIALAYAQVGAAIGPAASVIVYGYAARLATVARA